VGVKKMGKFKHRKLIISIAIIAILGLCKFTGVLTYVVARVSSSIYVTIHYPTKGFKFNSGEYAYGFGDYYVRYENKNEKTLGLMLAPKEFPMFVVWDSIKQDGFDD
jgi:hypothetical protein